MSQQTIALHRLSPSPGAFKARKRLGCGSGSGHGQTSTRGQKGQRSRSGDGKLVGFEGGQTPLLRRIPKRGFRNGAFRLSYQIVHLADMERVFANHAEVTVEALKMHKLAKGRAPVKILGNGDVRHPMKIQAHAFSKSAREKIMHAGGVAETVSY